MAVNAYRNNATFAAALATAKAAHGAAAAPQLQVLTHLAWRAPSGTVAWHKGTAPGMVSNAKGLGVVPGVALPKAVASVLAALPKHKANAALVAAVQAVQG